MPMFFVDFDTVAIWMRHLLPMNFIRIHIITWISYITIYYTNYYTNSYTNFYKKMNPKLGG